MLAGHLLEPRGGGRCPHPVIDRLLPQSPRRPGPDALWGDPPTPPEVVRSPAIERLRRQVFTQHMRRTRAFWHLPLIHGLGCAGHGIVLLYVVPLAVEQGLTLVAASMILSLISVCSIGSRSSPPSWRSARGQTGHGRRPGDPQGLTQLVLFWAHEAWTFTSLGLSALALERCRRTW